MIVRILLWILRSRYLLAAAAATTAVLMGFGVLSRFELVWPLFVLIQALAAKGAAKS